MSEITVILKDESRTFRQKYLIYETYSVSADDEIIISCIEDSKKNFDGEPTDIQIKINLEVL